MTAPSWSINRRAAAAIARHAVSPTECRELLDMLGLVNEGHLLPDDTAVYTLTDVGKAPGAQNPDAPAPRAFSEHGRRPDGMTTPAGLATLQPIEQQPVSKPRKVKPAVVKPVKPPVIPECGQYAAYSRHRRLGEPIDEACRRAQLDYQRQHSQKRRDAAKAAAAPTEAERLVAAGVNPDTAAYLGDKVRPTELEATA